MKNFKILLFWESFFIGISIIVWGFALSDNTLVTTFAVAAAAFAAALAAFVAVVFAAAAATFAAALAAAAFAVSVAITTFTFTFATFAVTTFVIFFTAVIAAAFAFTLDAVFALSSELQPRLRVPITISIAVEFATIFLLLNFGYWAIAVAGIAILFGMGILPEKLVTRPV